MWHIKRYFEFIIFVDFSQKTYLRWQLTTSLQNLIYLHKYVADIMLFVQKI